MAVGSSWLPHLRAVAGDWSCAMGNFSSTPRCFNPAKAWQLGWTAPQLATSTTVKAGSTIRVTFSAQTRSYYSGLKISPSWASGQSPLYLGYRQVIMDAGGSTEGRVLAFATSCGAGGVKGTGLLLPAIPP